MSRLTYLRIESTYGSSYPQAGRSLAYGHYPLGCDLAVAVAAVLPKMRNLKYLILDGHDIGDAGVEALAKVINQVPWLEEISLQHDGIGIAGAKALAEVLPKMTSLKRLRLEGNEIGDAGMEIIEGVARGLGMQSEAESLEFRKD